MATAATTCAQDIGSLPPPKLLLTGPFHSTPGDPARGSFAGGFVPSSCSSGGQERRGDPLSGSQQPSRRDASRTAARRRPRGRVAPGEASATPQRRAARARSLRTPSGPRPGASRARPAAGRRDYRGARPPGRGSAQLLRACPQLAGARACGALRAPDRPQRPHANPGGPWSLVSATTSCRTGHDPLPGWRGERKPRCRRFPCAGWPRAKELGRVRIPLTGGGQPARPAQPLALSDDWLAARAAAPVRALARSLAPRHIDHHRAGRAAPRRWRQGGRSGPQSRSRPQALTCWPAASREKEQGGSEAEFARPRTRYGEPTGPH